MDEEKDIILSEHNKKMSDLNKSTDDTISELRGKTESLSMKVSEKHNPSNPSPSSSDQPEGKTVDLGNITPVDDSNVTEDEANAALFRMLKNIMYFPDITPEKVVPMLREAFKAEMVRLDEEIQKINETLSKNIPRFKGIWDAFELGENESRSPMADAINEGIEHSKNTVEAKKHEIAVNQKTLLVLDEFYADANVNKNTFGRGLL
ncbi:hypothetical protein KAR91_55830 [Candidatus Pacearchaeota archaeon]|nr:hypothetical protein [Candidatus Pacearchaeota archaeon]